MRSRGRAADSFIQQLGGLETSKTWENLGIKLEFSWVKIFIFLYGTLFLQSEKLGHLDEELRTTVGNGT